MIPDLGQLDKQALTAVIYLLGVAISALLAALAWLASQLVVCWKASQEHLAAMTKTLLALKSHQNTHQEGN